MSLIIAAFVFIRLFRFFVWVGVVCGEGVVKYTDNLSMLAENLFCICVLTSVGFWHTGALYNIPAIIIAILSALSVFTNIQDITSGATSNFKELFSPLDPDDVRLFKTIIVGALALQQIMFFFILWLGGLFSLS